MRGTVFRKNLNNPLNFQIEKNLSNLNIYQEYLGQFEFRQGISEVAIQNNKLCINTPSRLEATPEKLTLVPVEKDSFMNLYDGSSISFVRNKNGSISHFLNGGYQYIRI
jgi:hypothetical protein